MPTRALAPFQAFQQQFAAYLRAPHHTPRPAGAPARASQLYSELVLANVMSFIDSCFPLCRTLLGDTRWQRLGRVFLRDGALHSPWFRDIPQQFVGFLASTPNLRLPRWLPELAHYEWPELAVDVMEAPVPPYMPDGNLDETPILVNPALLNLAYAWPVHRIGTNYRPRRPQPCCLVVYRDADDTVRFTELSPLSAHVLGQLIQSPQSGTEVLQTLATTLNAPDPQRFIAHGRALLADLHAQGIILGTLV